MKVIWRSWVYPCKATRRKKKHFVETVGKLLYTEITYAASLIKWLLGAFKGRLSAVKSCAFILRRVSDTSQGVYRRYLTCKVNVKCRRRRSDSPSNGGIVSVLLVLFCCFAGSKTFKPSFLHFYSLPPPRDGRRRQLSFHRMLSCPPLPPSSPLLPASPPPPTHTHVNLSMLEIVLLILPPTPPLSAFLTPPPVSPPLLAPPHLHPPLEV